MIQRMNLLPNHVLCSYSDNTGLGLDEEFPAQGCDDRQSGKMPLGTPVAEILDTGSKALSESLQSSDIG
jgi:hypothetical protein